MSGNLSFKTIPIAVLCALVLSSCNKTKDKFIEEVVVIQEDEKKNEGRIFQNRWTYAQMQENYLWEEYIPDSTSLQLTDSPTDFFNKLKYKGDRFSWIERNTDYSGTSLYDRFGVESVEYSFPSGGKVRRTALVLPRSSAEIAGLRRGDWFTITASNAAGMEIEIGTPDETGFRPEKRLVLSASEDAYTDAITLDTIYQIQNKKIGYLVYNSFQDGMSDFTYPYRTELKNIFGSFKQQGITDLIIDLRYNPGGYESIEQILCSLVLPDEYLGKLSGYHSYNKKQAALLLKETGTEEEVLHFPTNDVIGGNNLGLRKAYFIITGQSASASEKLINSLAPCISVVTVGSVSVGKNVGSYTIKDNRYEWQLQPITFYYYNREHHTVPETGIVPDIRVDENNVGTWYDLGDTRELLLNVTLEQITGVVQARSAIDYGQLPVKPTGEDGRQRRKTEGLIVIDVSSLRGR